MKNKILFLFFIPFLSFAQIGMNTTDPRTMLDINGAVTLRQANFTVASNAASINTDTSLASITGTATGTVTVTAFVPTIDGHLLTISNNTTGGFNAAFSGTTILNGQAVTFVYISGVWKTTLGTSVTATEIYNSNGTLTGNRTVTLGSNNLIFSGGRTEFQAPVELDFAKDTRMGISAVYNTSIGDAYGMEKVSAAQTGTTDALRFFTANAATAHLAFGKYTNTTAFTTFARFTNTGSFGVGISPASTFQVNGSIANSITVISADLTLDQTHKTVIIPLGSAFTVTLPAASSGITGRIYNIINNSASSKSLTVNYINLAGSSVNTINASSCIEVQSDGINWYQIR